MACETFPWQCAVWVRWRWTDCFLGYCYYITVLLIFSVQIFLLIAYGKSASGVDRDGDVDGDDEA